MKKLIAFILLIVMICGLCGCGKSETAIALPSTNALNQTVNNSEQQEEKSLMVLLCEIAAGSEEDIQGYCDEVGIDLSYFDDHMFYYCRDGWIECRNVLLAYGKLDYTDFLIVGPEEYCTQAETLWGENPDIAQRMYTLCMETTDDGSINATSSENDESNTSITENYELLILSEEDAKLQNATVLLRDGKMHSLASYATLPGSYNYVQRILYTKNDGNLLSCGKVPVLTYKSEDIIAKFSKTTANPILTLTPVKSVGCMINMVYTKPFGGGHYYLIRDLTNDNYYELNERDISNFTVQDSAGNVLADYLDVGSYVEGEMYLVSWFTGTQYNEVNLVADCTKYECTDGDAYELEGTPTKDGYASYDLSEVKSGLYKTSDSGLIYIE